MKIVLGTMTLGESGLGARIKDPKDVKEVLDTFKSYGHDELDTARMYCSGNTERMLGDLQAPSQFTLATKVFPVEAGDHKPEKLKATFKKSLEMLKVDKVDIFYLHAPDRATPFQETLEAVNELHKSGHFKEFGLSNYSAWEVAEIVIICKERGFVLPTIYQGMYNAVTRLVELELFACLRKFGIRFYAYNPLVGGLLAGGSPTRDSEIESGSRYDESTAQGKRYRDRYWKQEYFDAIDSIKAAASKHGISAVEAGLRWMVHHSKLDTSKGDAVIIGASSMKHLRENLDALKKGPLDQAIIDAFDEGWKKTIFFCQNYDQRQTDWNK
eukprot:TRINITY_DN2279_c0_g1_i2.p1 TRINITY_DN2279_c0_g1~~TRINITY_DN2279_c0_g1_i2.p1  ORF type:complete len:327 (+),score=94.51 TRINITY_DN2279_c0_g1_i2:128-1108(+)